MIKPASRSLLETCVLLRGGRASNRPLHIPAQLKTPSQSLLCEQHRGAEPPSLLCSPLHPIFHVSHFLPMQLPPVGAAWCLPKDLCRRSRVFPSLPPFPDPQSSSSVCQPAPCLHALPFVLRVHVTGSSQKLKEAPASLGIAL